MNKFPKKEVHAVHDEDLEKVLERLGILVKLKRGGLKCKFCSRVITLENLHSYFPQSGDIKFVCDNANCIKKMLGLLRKEDVSL